MAELLGQVARTAAPDVRAHAEHLLAAARRPCATAPRAADAPPRKGSASASVRCCACWRPSSPGRRSQESLYVSVNTLRTHTKHIFSKLDVNTRRAAVRRAADLGAALSGTAGRITTHNHIIV